MKNRGKCSSNQYSQVDRRFPWNLMDILQLLIRDVRINLRRGNRRVPKDWTLRRSRPIHKRSVARVPQRMGETFLNTGPME